MVYPAKAEDTVKPERLPSKKLKGASDECDHILSPCLRHRVVTFVTINNVSITQEDRIVFIPISQT